MKRFDDLDIIIPVSLDLDWPETDTIVREILWQYENYGFTRFALACPCGGWRSIGYPPTEFFAKRAKMFVEIRDALLPHGIECGWWITTTVKSGLRPEFTPVIRADGSVHPFANCPLDPAFRKRLAGDMAVFAKIAKPAFIITEDDFSVHAAGGCFCEKHLAEFAHREGKAYTREELTAQFTGDSPERFSLLRRWRDLTRDSLVGLAEEIRRAVDADSPEIPMGYMQSGAANLDGNCTLAVSKALAGPGHTPFSRLFGIRYCGMKAEHIPGDLFQAFYHKQHIHEDFIFYHESDSFPHTRFYTSGKKMNCIMGAVYSAGFDGSTFQTQQLLDHANEETAYGKMFSREKLRLNALHKAARQCQLKGAELCYDPFWNTLEPSVSIPNWTDALSRFCIPWITTDANVAFWDKAQAKYSDDAAIRRYLSKKLLFLDAEAAKILCERGYGAYLGVTIGEPVNGIPGNENLQWDLGAREVIRKEFVPGDTGRNMPSAHMLAASNGKMLQMQITDPACRIITDMYTYDKRYVTPSMTCFRNSLDGTVVIMGITLANNNSQSLYNYRRQRLIHMLIREYCDELVFVPEAPQVFVLMNDAVDEKACGFRHLLTLINLSDDTLEETAVHLPPAWKNIENIQMLNRAGEWQTIPYSVTEDGITITEPLAYLEPVYLLFR